MRRRSNDYDGQVLRTSASVFEIKLKTLNMQWFQFIFKTLT